MSELRAVRKYAAQHDLFNRLHSIAADEAFVRTVAQGWYDGRFDVVANQRCGNWYCDPSTSSKVYAYFKSTDGHMFHWDFNLRRSNLSLASHAEERGGCAVINLAIAKRYSTGEDWDTTLYLPPQIVPSTERSQIESHLEEWATALEVSSECRFTTLTAQRSTLPLPQLRKPLRPFFIHPSTSAPPHIPASPDFTPIICLSASRWVNNGADEIPSVTKVGKRTVGFEYVPGGGDDDELWARGLTPPLFHANKESLLSTERDDLPQIVDDIVSSSSFTSIPQTLPPSHAVGVPSSSSYLGLDIGQPIGTTSTWSQTSSSRLTIHVVEIDKHPKNVPHLLPFKNEGSSILAVPSAKSDGKAYATALTELVEYVQDDIGDGALLLKPGLESDLKRAMHNYTSSDNADSQPPTIDPSPPPPLIDSRKVIIPLAVVLLCSVPELNPEAQLTDSITKGVIADQLHSLVALWPDGNPPRASLKRVNEFLMGQGRRR
ncbi:hypothetical protein CI109_101479 [Kwoniella shandongensis]|uniref:Initiator tRNA phosphoribosyl transferase n=1 Tax=Kwoniella shandongensis TaxID=1734106 RepID=A0AAJ8LFS4_9TREE